MSMTPALQRGLEYLESRLSCLADDKTEVPTWQGNMRRYTINDPGTSARRINDAADRNSDDGRAGSAATIVRVRRVPAE